MPRHIAVIMDGNGRWAQQRGLPRIEGHRRGAASVRRVTEECARLGIEQLTLYCLSSENWKRPAEELDFLMQLLQQYMVGERPTDHGAQHPGDRDRPPRRAAGKRAARTRRDRRAEPRRTPACGSAWRSTTAAGRNWSMPCGASPARSRPGDSIRPTSTKRRSTRIYTRPACPNPIS